MANWYSNSFIYNFKMNKKWIWINTIFSILFILVGYLALIVIFHETWHIINNGIPDGICVGNLNATGGTAIAGVFFSPTPIFDLQEEKNAWLFGVIISSILLIIYIVSEVIIRIKNKNDTLSHPKGWSILRE